MTKKRHWLESVFSRTRQDNDMADDIPFEEVSIY